MQVCLRADHKYVWLSINKQISRKDYGMSIVEVQLTHAIRLQVHKTACAIDSTNGFQLPQKLTFAKCSLESD